MKRRVLIIVFLVLVGGSLASCQHVTDLSDGGLTQNEGIVWSVAGNTHETDLMYETPGGVERQKLSLTVEDGVVTGINMTIETSVAASIEYQKGFLKEVEPLVVGVPLAQLGEFDGLSGASLTTNAFNEAVDILAQQLL